MPRHIQPRELAELKGATKIHPERYRKTVPESEKALGLCPEYMAEDAQTAWFELESYALKGVLTGSDRFMMEITATLLAEFRRDPSEFQVGKYGQLNSCLARLGMSPSDRQKLGTEKAKDANPFDEF